MLNCGAACEMNTISHENARIPSSDGITSSRCLVATGDAFSSTRLLLASILCRLSRGPDHARSHRLAGGEKEPRRLRRRLQAADALVAGTAADPTGARQRTSAINTTACD